MGTRTYAFTGTDATGHSFRSCLIFGHTKKHNGIIFDIWSLVQLQVLRDVSSHHDARVNVCLKESKSTGQHDIAPDRVWCSAARWDLGADFFGRCTRTYAFTGTDATWHSFRSCLI